MSHISLKHCFPCSLKVSIDIEEFISPENSTVIFIIVPIALFYDINTTRYNIFGMKDNPVIF